MGAFQKAVRKLILTEQKQTFVHLQCAGCINLENPSHRGEMATGAENCCAH